MDFQFLAVEKQKVKDEYSLSFWLNGVKHIRFDLKYHLRKGFQSYM